MLVSCILKSSLIILDPDNNLIKQPELQTKQRASLISMTSIIASAGGLATRKLIAGCGSAATHTHSAPSLLFSPSGRLSLLLRLQSFPLSEQGAQNPCARSRPIPAWQPAAAAGVARGCSVTRAGLVAVRLTLPLGLPQTVDLSDSDACNVPP